MTESKISRAHHCQLLGLFTLAEQHNAALRDIERSAASLVGENDDGSGYYGHVSDALCNGDSAAHMLKKLGIRVAK